MNYFDQSESGSRIEPATVQNLENWLHAYAGAFLEGESELARMSRLKLDHTLRVRDEIVWLCGELALDLRTARIAEIVALCHDVGRFEQFRRHGTFNDLKSEDHASLGAHVLLEEGALAALEPCDQDLAVRAVLAHNKRSLPEGETEEGLLQAKLIRDADKIDIYHVVLEEAAQSGAAARFGMEEGDDVCEPLANQLLAGESPDYALLRTAADFVACQLSWAREFNFPAALRRVSERDCFRLLAERLPDAPRARAVKMAIFDFLERAV